MTRVALLHYWLTNMRGGENVLVELCNLYPAADIFTHAYNPQKVEPIFSKHRVRETFIGRLPGARRGCQKYLPLMPLALKFLDLSGYDLLVSSESGPIKGIRKPASARHICYCHTPMRYLWDMYEDYYRSAGLAGKIAMRVFRDYLRNYDRKSADAVDLFIANSAFVAERIQRIYRRSAVVVAPPVDTAYFSAARREEEDFFLYVGALVPYKRADLAAAACVKMGKKLVIVGDGPMVTALKTQYGDNPLITFAGRRGREELRRWYARARALIFPGIEDFGIVPVEAQAAGCPVIALGIGGALETVRAGESGIFFSEPTETALCGAIEQFGAQNWDAEPCRRNAERFTPEIFRKNFLKACE